MIRSTSLRDLISHKVDKCLVFACPAVNYPKEALCAVIKGFEDGDLIKPGCEFIW